MGVVVKDGVRYRAKDAARVDVVSSVQVKVPVPDTDAWAAPQSESDGAEETDETATKVVDPEVTKVREPDTTKSGRGRK